MITYLIHKMDVNWLRTHQIPLLGSLLYLIRDLPPSISVTTSEDTIAALISLVKTCQMKLAGDTAEQLKQRDDVVGFLASQIHSPSSRVRKNALTALETLANINTFETLPELLKKHVDSRILAPIYAEPLVNLPRAVQTGYIEAMTHCMNLRPPVLNVDDRLPQRN